MSTLFAKSAVFAFNASEAVTSAAFAFSAREVVTSATLAFNAKLVFTSDVFAFNASAVLVASSLRSWSPVLVPDKFATAPLANMALVIAPLAMDVALPTLVTTPVKFALVVTVAALPVVFWFSMGKFVNPAALPVGVK